VDDVGLFVANGCVIVSDPREGVLDNQFGEDHVNVNILYCLNNFSGYDNLEMAIGTNHCGWALLKQLFVSYDENKILTVDEKG